MARRDPGVSCAPQGEAGDLALHGWRHDASRHVRPQAEAGGNAWPADAGELHFRPADRAAARLQAHLSGPPASLPPRRAKRSGDRHHFSGNLGADRRPDRDRAFDAHRGDQPRSSTHLHEYRIDDLRAAGGGQLALVWPRQRCPEPARICRDGQHRKLWPEAADRQPAVAFGPAPEPVSGSVIPLAGRSCFLREVASRRGAGPATRCGRCGDPARQLAGRVGQRSGNRRPARAI